MQRAVDARELAYAPYSNFRVGAAVLTPTGEVFLGANVENASYGLTICAERVALSSAIAAGEREVTAIAVASGPGASMCGACRQFLAEFSNPRTLVLLAKGDGQFERTNVQTLLPGAFGAGAFSDPDDDHER